MIVLQIEIQCIPQNTTRAETFLETRQAEVWLHIDGENSEIEKLKPFRDTALNNFIEKYIDPAKFLALFVVTDVKRQ